MHAAATPGLGEQPAHAHALDAAACFTLAVVIGLHLNILGDYTVSLGNIEWMREKVQGFLSGLYQYVPELCRTLRRRAVRPIAIR